MQSHSASTDPTTAQAAAGWAATRAAQAGLRSPAPAYTDVIVWLSEHLAALAHVVEPAARARLGADAPSVRCLLVATRRVERTLRLLHGRLNGDTAAAHLPLPDLHQVLDDELAVLLGAEDALAAELQPALSPGRWDRLVDQYADAVIHGPTRPHPYAPHGRVLGRAAFHVLAAADHLMDVLDSRPVHDVPAAPLATARQDRPDSLVRPAA